MANEEKAATKEQNIDVTELLNKQAAEFKKLMEEQAKANKEQIDALVENNNALKEELQNLKTNTEAENKLLGENIAAIKEGKAAAPLYDPFNPDLLYKVHNEIANIDTIMTGDEIEGIIGVVQKHLRGKLVAGEEKIEKHPYTIVKLGLVGEVKEKDLKV